MALSSLLKNQTIRIDNHNSAHAITWERSLHLHKRTNGVSKSSVDCLIYFVYNDDNAIVFPDAKKGNRAELEETERLKKEIRDAFQDPDVRMNFINSFYNAIAPLLKNDQRTDVEIAKVARRAAKRIIKAFGLSAYVTKEFDMYSRFFYIYKFKCKRYVAVDYINKRILAGDSIDEIKKEGDVINVRY